MRAIILAAGRGRRIAPLSDQTPKCLIKVRGTPLIDLQISALKLGGISEIGIVTGYKREALRDRKMPEFYNSDWATTNMVKSLCMADAWLTTSPCLVSYSDIFYGSKAVRMLAKSTSILGITYDPNWLTLWEERFDKPLEDAETFRIDENYLLEEIGKKGNDVNDIQGQYMGLLRFTPTAWSEVQSILYDLGESVANNIDMTTLLQKVIERNNIKIHGIPYNGRWGEVDTEKDLQVYQKFSA